MSPTPPRLAAEPAGLHPAPSGRILRSRLLSRAGIAHGFTTRVGGVSSGRHATLNVGTTWGDEPDRVAQNLALIAAEGGFALESLCQVVQVHGAQVLTLLHAERRAREADGMATAARLCLGVMSADCVGLVLGDGRGRVAAAHAGWRGTLQDMAGAAVRAVVELGARPEQVWAAMGPSIGPCCFEVQADVAEPFLLAAPDAVRREGERTYVDLYQANRARLLSAGVRAERIEERPPCTACDAGRFYSYRRDGARIGQHLAYIIGGPA